MPPIIPYFSAFQTDEVFYVKFCYDVSETGRSCNCIFHNFLFSSEAFAQPNLNFKRITVNWPTIVKLYLQVGCNGLPSYNLSQSDFQVYENGIAVSNFTLWCPDPTQRCKMSVSLVFDESGKHKSGNPNGISGEKVAGDAFVEMMDGLQDEAGLSVSINQCTRCVK